MDVLERLQRKLQTEIVSDTALVMTGACDTTQYIRLTARVEAYNTIIALLEQARHDAEVEFEPREEDFARR